MEEHVSNRNYIIGVLYVFNNKLGFVIHNKFLCVNKIVKDGKPIDPLSLIDKTSIIK